MGITSQGIWSQKSSVMKYLAHPFTDCNRKVLLMLCMPFVRPILDHGPPIYGLTPKFNLQSLNPSKTWPFVFAQGVSVPVQPSAYAPTLESLPSTVVASTLLPTSSPLSLNSHVHPSINICSTLSAIAQSTDKRTITCALSEQKVHFHYLSPLFPSTPPWCIYLKTKLPP